MCLSVGLRIGLDRKTIFIKWSAWLLLSASALLVVGLSLELAGSEDPEVQSVRQGIIGLGGLLLNVDTIFGVFMQVGRLRPRTVRWPSMAFHGLL